MVIDCQKELVKMGVLEKGLTSLFGVAVADVPKNVPLSAFSCLVSEDYCRRISGNLEQKIKLMFWKDLIGDSIDLALFFTKTEPYLSEDSSLDCEVPFLVLLGNKASSHRLPPPYSFVGLWKFCFLLRVKALLGRPLFIRKIFLLRKQLLYHGLSFR